MSSTLLFDTLPYLALAVMVAVFVARAIATSSAGRVFRTRVAEARDLFGGSLFWRLGLLVVLLVHVAVLAAPRGILAWNASAARLYLLEGAGAVAGLFALAGAGVLAYRHFRHRQPSLGVDIADSAFVALLVVALVTGLAMAGVYRWSSSWGAAVLAPYLASLAEGRVDTRFVDQMPFVVRLHVVAAFGLLGIFPFTRLTPLTLAGLHWLATRTVVPVGAVVKSVVERPLRALAATIWPEEDAFDAPWTPPRPLTDPAALASARPSEPGDTVAYQTTSKP